MPRNALTALPSPQQPAQLLALPTDLLSRIVSQCDPVDIARVAAVSLLLHESVVEEGLHLRAQELGYELPPRLAVRSLCLVALQREANLPARVAAGSEHSVFINGEGRLFTCGKPESYLRGILGHGGGVEQLHVPTQIPSMLDGERAVSVDASGGEHNLCITTNGSLWSWGYGSLGCLGHGSRQCEPQPRRIDALAGHCVVALSTAFMHSVAVTADGAVWSWGGGSGYKLGHGDRQCQLQPKKVETLAQKGLFVTAVAARGDKYTLAVTADGAVWSWGIGQLGYEQPPGDVSCDLTQPKRIEALDGQHVVAVTAGANHSLALTAAGGVWSWGEGSGGKLGHGDERSQPQPKRIEALAGHRVVAVSAGSHHCLAVTAGGAVWSWGGNRRNCELGAAGCLGHGTSQNQLLPKKIEALAGRRVVAVSAGGSHSLAISGDGAVWSWGDRYAMGHGVGEERVLQPKKIEQWTS